MNNILAYREKAGLSQGQLGIACGWGEKSQSRVSNYENNVRTPSLEDMRALTAALSQNGAPCSIDDLFPPQDLADKVVALHASKCA